MPILLVVNDDGIDSPMLPPMAAKLAALGTVRIAVPLEEQSWKGKAITRFGRVEVERRPEFGVEAFAVAGTPSDCVNLAAHHLFGEPPDWILSGINIGSNAGAGFIINSGTVGAAFEGALQGIPSVAFSACFAPEQFRQWSAENRLTSPAALEVIDSTTTRAARMMASIMANGMPGDSVILNINFPARVGPDTPVRWVPVQNNRYGAVFRRDADGFVPCDHVGLTGGEDVLTDRAVVLRGEISVSALSIAAMGVPPSVAIPF